MRRIAAWAALIAWSLPAPAWNGTGHRIVAAIAYERLTPRVRAKVDDLIRQHPDYHRLFTLDAPADAPGRARSAFLFAATWPDVIRGDGRFYDETSANAVATPLLPGFPDMARHVTWHYYDVPYTPDGARSEIQPPPHALSELRRLITEMKTSPAKRVYDLPWLMHIEGDVHQPLHTTSRFLISQPKGDAGGNYVYIAPNTNLHSVWDGLAGADVTDVFITKQASEIAHEHPESGGLSADPRRWINESFALVKSDVYTFGLETGTKEHPLTLPSGYEEKAKRTARARIAVAGYRLAAVLNEELK